MKKFNVMVIFAAFILIIATGCSISQNEEKETPSPSPTIETVEIPSPVPEETPGNEEVIKFEDQNRISFEYYDINSDSKIEKEYDTNGKATKETPLEVVNQALLGEDAVKANSIVLTNGNLFIDFDESIYDLRAGSSTEGALLDAIADAYLNNIQGIKAVYYSVNGESYATGHYELDKGQPYKTK